MKRLIIFILVALLMQSSYVKAYNFISNVNGREWKIKIISTNSAIIEGVTESANNCSGILNIPDHVNDNGINYTIVGIYEYAFNDYKLITSVTLPSTCYAIGRSSFNGCTRLTSINLSHTKAIPKDAFYRCSSLTSVNLSSAEVIEERAFYGCSSLTQASFPNIRTLGKGAFQLCDLHGVLSIPNAITRIEDTCFYGNTNLTKLEIPDNIQYIGNMAFYGCTGLRGDFTIPDAPIIYGNEAFRDCGFDGKLTILRQVSTGNITSELPFAGTKFSEIIIGGEQPIRPVTTGSSFGPITITVLPSVKKIPPLAFKEVNIANSTLIIPEGVEEIGEFAFENFYNQSNPIQLQLPSTLKKIGTFAFHNKEFVGHLNIPENVITIGDFAFQSSKFNRVTFSTNLKELGNGAFANCTSLTGDLILPEGLTKIGYNAFRGCSALNGNLVIPNSTTSIGYCAFMGCTNLKADVNNILRHSLTAIGSNAFYNCKNIKGEAILPSPYEIIYDPIIGGDLGASPAVPVLHTGVWGLKIGPWDKLFHPNMSNNIEWNWLKDAGLFYIDARYGTVALTNNKGESNTCYKFTRERFLFMETQKFANFSNSSVNTIIYLPPESEFTKPSMPNVSFLDRFDDNGENFVMDGKCAHFFVKDGLPYRIPYSFTALEAKYDRVFSPTGGKNVSTLYLPYPTDLPTGMKAYELVEKGFDINGVKAFIFKQVSTPLRANTPYLVQVTDGATHTLPTMYNVEVPASPCFDNDSKYIAPGYKRSFLHATSTADWNFYGTTERINNDEAYTEKAFYLNGSQWWSVNQNVENDYIAPFRCFISSPNGSVAAKSFMMVLDGGENTTNSINELENNTNNDIQSGHYPFYTTDGKLAGHDYNALTRGQIYIVNGKKFYKF